MYACPVRHCTSRPNSSRSFLRCRKCGVGFSDGGRRFAAAYRPTLGLFFHSSRQSFSIDDLDRLSACLFKLCWRYN